MTVTLLVEDNVSLAETVIAYFGLEGIDCDYASTGPQGLELALSNDYQTILLDINLPRMNGLEVCEALRNQKQSLQSCQRQIDSSQCNLEKKADEPLLAKYR